MTRLKRFASFTELKSNANSIPEIKRASQPEDHELKDFLQLLSKSLLSKDKDKRETKHNNIKNG